MCNRYHPPSARQIHDLWGLSTKDVWRPGLGPWGQGPFIRHDAHGQAQLVVGQWALIGDRDKKASSRPRMTNNARLSSIASRPTFAGPWARGQRCVIPAVAYDEPNWESGKAVWWSMRRADGLPWNLAGLWNRWTDPETGEIHESYTMITDNADHHPLLRRLHKADPTRPEDEQDKRAVIPLRDQDLQAWLGPMPPEQARQLLVLPDVSVYVAGPSNATPPMERPNA